MIWVFEQTYWCAYPHSKLALCLTRASQFAVFCAWSLLCQWSKYFTSFVLAFCVILYWRNFSMQSSFSFDATSLSCFHSFFYWLFHSKILINFIEKKSYSCRSKCSWWERKVNKNENSCIPWFILVRIWAVSLYFFSSLRCIAMCLSISSSTRSRNLRYLLESLSHPFAFSFMVVYYRGRYCEQWSKITKEIQKMLTALTFIFSSQFF